MISNHIARIIAACMPATLILTVMFGCTTQNNTAPIVPPPEPVNNAPLISSLTADQQVAEPLGKVVLNCRASDPESDNLSYRWTASGGFIEGSAETVSWTAPDSPGSYKVTVVVSDGRGGATAADALITIPEKTNNPPVISAINFMPAGRTIILKRNPTAAEINKVLPIMKRTDTAYFECISTDPDKDELTYVWKASGGGLTGGGPKIFWRPPTAAADYTITCEISDGKGGTDSFTVTITVKCCSG